MVSFLICENPTCLMVLDLRQNGHVKRRSCLADRNADHRTAKERGRQLLGFD